MIGIFVAVAMVAALSPSTAHPQQARGGVRAAGHAERGDQPPVNQCVACHEGLPAATAGGHSFLDWRQSPHGQGGATCDKCHGGDPTQTDQQLAHGGVYSSREPRSTVYYTNIPATCGSCHTRELGFFKQSRHYAQLESSGRGPNCVTCHGSMATRVLEAKEMEETCSACHNALRGPSPAAPIAARYLLELMQEVAFGISATQQVSDLGDRAARRAAATYMKQARASMQLARESWHSFDLDQVETMLVRTAAAARQADSVLGGGKR
jgi:hypothetical protein